MAGSSFNFDFTARVQGDVSDVRKQLAILKTELGKLEIPKKSADGFLTNLKKVESKLEDFEAKAQKGIANKNDMRSVIASYNQLTDSIRKAGFAMDRINDLDNLFDPATSKKIKEATRALQEYEKSVKNLQKNEAFQEQRKKTEKARTDLNDRKDRYQKAIKAKESAQELLAKDQANWNKSARKRQYDAANRDKEAWQNELDAVEKKLRNQASVIEEFKKKNQSIMDSAGTKLSTSFHGQKKELQNQIEAGSQANIATLKADLEQAKVLRQKYQEELESATDSQAELATKLSSKKKEYRGNKTFDQQKELLELEQELKAARAMTNEATKKSINQDKTVTSLEDQLAVLEKIDVPSLQKKMQDMQELQDTYNDLLETQKKYKEQKADLEKDERSKGPDKKHVAEKEGLEKKKHDLSEQTKNLNREKAEIEKAEAEQIQREAELQQKRGEILATSLKGLKTAFGDIGFGDEVDGSLADLEKLYNLLEKFKEESASNKPEALKNLQEGLQGLGQAADKVGEGVSEADDALTTFTEKQKDMDRMKQSVLDFFSIGNAIRLFKRSVRDAFETVKDLDKAMTETAVVTDYSIEDMWKKLPKYTKIANELGTTTQGAYETMTLFYQQGLKSDQAFEVGTETMKMARIANMDYAHATNLMTAALRGFNMELNQDSAQRINDVYSELAAITAADTSEIATAMTKTASIANSANMEFETTAALLTQIIETTRESPETAGTALKTVIARFQELTKAPGELLEVDGEKVDANKIEHALRSVGVALRDNVTGQFRDLDDVFLELASKWDTLDTNTQRYIATIAAGSRQQSRFLAMMSNYERTQELIDSAQNSEGAGQAQFEKTLDSLDSKLNKLHNAWDEFAMGLADSSTIKIGTDALTTLLGFINKITDFSGKGTGLMSDLAMPFSEMSKILLTMASIKMGRGLFQGFTGDKGFRGALSEEFATFGNLRATIFDTKEDLEAFNAPIQQATKGGEKQLKVAKQRKGVLASELGLTQKIGRTALKTLGKTQKFAWAGKMASSGLAAGVTGGLTVVAVLAVIAAAIAAFKGFKKYFTAGGRLDTAEKVSKNMSSAAEEAKNAYKELDSSLENVQSRLQGIQDLTKGTQEWKDATHEVNAELLQIIEKTPEMAKAVTFKDGVGQINNEIASGILADKREQMLIAEQASLIADQQVFERESDKYYSDIKSHSHLIDNNNLDYDGAIGTTFKSGSRRSNSLERELSEELSRLIASGEILDVDSARQWAYEKAAKGNYATSLMNFDQVDFNKMRSRGKELLANDQKNRLQSQQTIDQILDGMSFASNKTRDILGTIDKDLTTKKLKDLQLQALDSIPKDWKGVYKPTAEQEQAFANSRGWTWVDDDTYINTENEKVSGMRDQAAYYAAAEQAKASYEVYASKLGNFVDNLGPAQAQKFSELMSEDGINISTKTLKGLETATTSFEISAGQNGESLPEDVAKMAKALDGATSLDGDALAKTFGKENFKDLAESLDMSTTELGQELLNNVNAANERINDQRLDITRDLIRVGAADNFEQGLDLYQRLEKSFSSNPDVFRNAYQGLLQSFGDIGDQGLSNTIFGTINKKIESGLWGLESLTKLSTFGTGLDFTNPLSTVRQLKSAARDATSEVGQLSQEILDSDSALLSGAAQFRHLLKSTDFDAISEDISDIVSETGELNGDDVLALADNYEYLAQVLDETGASAEGLAAALAMVAEGSLSLDEITDTVLAALESYESLDSLVANTLKGIEEFDPGVDENEAAGFISDAFNTLNDNLSRGAYGNSQNKAYMDYLFSTAERKWDEGLTADQRVSRMKAARDKLENNTAFMKDLWQNAANNQDFWGTANATNAFTEAGIKVFENGSEIMVEELVEGSGALTTQNLTSALMKSLGVSEQMANLMITDFKNYGDQDMVDVLNANDKNQAYDAAYQKALETGRVDQREFETIDKFYGEENGGFGAYFEERRRQDMADVNSQNYQAAGQVAITDFYENGVLKETTALVKELNQLKKPGDTSWADQFAESPKGRAPSGTYQHDVYDYDAAKAELAELGITGQNAANVIQESFTQAATAGGEQLKVSYTNAFGEVKTIAVEANQTIEQAIAKDTQADTFAKQAEAMKAAFSDVEISFVASDEELISAQGNLTEILAKDGSKVNIKFTDNGTIAAVKGQYAGIKSKDVQVHVTATGVEAAKAAIASVAGAAGGASVGKGSSAGGVVNSPRTYESLTGEEGPELVWSGNRSYLVGTNGPQMATIKKGDTVYTAAQTRKILRNKKIKEFGSFSGGTKRYSFGGYGDTQLPEDDKPSHGGGNSGSKKKDKDEKPWKNPYDALYNLIRQIDEEMRKRNRIERAYQKELKNINLNAKKLAQNTKELMEQLLLEKGANEERIKRRKDQIRQYQAKNSKYNKYGSIDENGNLRINWELIDSVKDSEEGKNIEEYISQLEEWADDINSAEDAINDIEDQIEEIKEQRKQSYLDFEDEIKDALLKLRQDEIDELSAINQNISDSNSRIISAMEKSISKMRQDRQNEKTEQDLQEKYRRLAYLSQDSSNANDLEIFNTEEGLKEAEENYTDELVDQKISQLQDQNDLAAQQREKQITILQSQLEHYEESGEVYRNIESLIRNSIASDGSIIMKSELASLLKQASNWDGLSETMKADWEQKYKGDVAQAFDYLTNKDESFEADMSKIVETVYKPKEVGDGSSGGSSGSGGGGGSGGSSGTKPSTSPGSYSASAQWTHYYHSSGSVLHYSDTMSKTSTKSQADAQSKADTAAASASSESYRQACNAKEAWDRQHKSNPKPQSKPQKSDIDKQREQYEQANGKPAPFKTGGLADYTGPAWLDGTRSRPELVLNAQDTRNFIQLKDILSNLLGQGPTFNSQNNGEISYDIDINVEKISDDYDVDQIADRIRRLILTDAKYRNNNIPAARLY